MKTFPLRIGTPDGLLFSGDVVRVVCRTITGDRAILADHIDFCTGIGMGEARVVLEDGTVQKGSLHRGNAHDGRRDVPASCNYLGVE